MTESRTCQLEALLLAIESQIATAHDCGLGGLAFTLGIAKLQLQMQLYGISQEELRLFCKAHDDSLPCDERAAARYKLGDLIGDGKLPKKFKALTTPTKPN